MALKDLLAVSKTCGEAIEEIERDRYKTSSPYLQSAFLKDRASLYRLGVGAAFQLGDYETMLVRAELSKGRSALRIHSEKDAPPPDPKLERRFRELCDAICAQDPRGDARSGAPKSPRTPWTTYRRSVANSGTCSRLRVSEPLTATSRLCRRSPCAVQNAIEPDEAILYYYWLGPEVLLVVAIDQQRLVVDHVVLSAAHGRFLDDVITAIRTFSGAMDPDTLCEFDRTVQECFPFWLPKKVWALMEGKRRLIVSPHHKLHLFPFHALPWKDGLLIESFAVSYVPNLSLLLVPARPAQRPKILLSEGPRFC